MKPDPDFDIKFTKHYNIAKKVVAVAVVLFYCFVGYVSYKAWDELHNFPKTTEQKTK